MTLRSGSATVVESIDKPKEEIVIMTAPTDMLALAREYDEATRVHDVVKEYQHVLQGDLAVVRIPDLEKGRESLTKLTQAIPGWESFRLGPIGPETDNLQLVDGITPGSRHCVDERDRSIVTVYARSSQAHELEGPVIVAKGRWRLTHPVHADHEMPEGIYQVKHQRDFAYEEARRIAD